MSTDKKDKNLNVPTLRFPGFTDEWQTRKLGDDCNILMCKRIFSNQTSEDGEIPFFKIGTIGGIPDAFISRELFNEYKHRYNFPNKGEVMVTCAGTVGRTIVFDGEDSYFQDSNIVWIDNPKQVVSNAFLYYIISKIDWGKLNTTTIVRIYNEDLRNQKISFPKDKNEQEKIVHLLKLLDERIATQSKIIERLESLIGGIVVSHFYSCEEKETIKIKDLGEEYSVGNLAKEDLSDEGEPCIIYGELFTTYGCVADKIKSKTTKYLQATLSKAGDLLFPASTTVDAISLISPTSLKIDGVYVAGDMFGIHIKDRYNSEYVSYLLNFVYNKELFKYAKGSTIIHLHYVDIKEASIQVPHISQQNQCANLLADYQKRLDMERCLCICFQKQKDFLLQKLFI